jgi:hypothetical protein
MDKIGTFGIFERMSQKSNKELKVAPLSNVKSACSGKNGWGSVTIAIPDKVITNFLMNPDFYVGGFVICDRKEFEKEKSLLESEE